MPGDKSEEEEVLTTCMNFVEWVNDEFNADVKITDETMTDTDKIHINVPGQGHLHVDRKTGEVETKITGTLPDKLREALGQKPAPSASIEANFPKERLTSISAESPTHRAVIPRDVPVRDMQISDLTVETIIEYLCPDATDQEAFMFLQLCRARNLNPFTNECYLVKYGKKAQMIVGKEAFMRKAEMHPQYEGFKAGILVAQDEDGDGLEAREGTFLMRNEKLLGGWAEVYRKDRRVPIRSEVSLKDFKKNTPGPWADMPAVMIRKVAIVQAHREAFPSDLSGCYDSAEFRDSPEIIDAEMVEA